MYLNTFLRLVCHLTIVRGHSSLSRRGGEDFKGDHVVLTEERRENQLSPTEF